MPDPSAPRRDGRATSHGGDGWGPSTAVYGSTARQSDPRQSGQRHPDQRQSGQRRTAPPVDDRRSPASRARSRQPSDQWSPAGPASREHQRADRRMERQIEAMRYGIRPPERGVRWWVGLAVLVVIAALGAGIDALTGSSGLSGGFNIGIIVACIVGILIVKRSHMFPIVVAPPIVYSVAAVIELYLRSGGLHDKKVVLDAAANYLVYGFPAIAAATAAVLIIAGLRLVFDRPKSSRPATNR